MVSGTEPRSEMCKASAQLTLLSLRPLFSATFKAQPSQAQPLQLEQGRHEGGGEGRREEQGSYLITASSVLFMDCGDNLVTPIVLQCL